MALLGELLARRTSSAPLLREERRLEFSARRLVVSVAPLTAGPEGRERTCVLAEDVTASRALDEEVAQSRRLRAVGELVGGIAHEFNNLLTPVMLKVGEIRMDHADDAKLGEDLRPIAEAARRAADLTSRLLTLGRKARAKAEDVDVASVVAGCLALLRSTLDRRIILVDAVAKDLPPVRINATDLSQVVLNLIINARDALLEKLGSAREGFAPEVRVEARFVPGAGSPEAAEKGVVRLTVADNGTGMSREVRDRMFEPFFTTKDVGKGTGLGLATVWHMVSSAGGRLEVESEPGQGSRFHVDLPAAPDGVLAAPGPAAPKGTVVPARVFLGEDDDLVARAVVDAMRRAGHSVHRLADGAESWSHLKAHARAYELVLLDVNMPGLDGVEVVRRLRGEGGFPGAIVVLSGRLTSEQRRTLWAAPVNEILEKPFEPERLLAAVGRCVPGG
jgi:signal transduction histidine kinase/CheY-like chemotaxis protein